METQKKLININLPLLSGIILIFFGVFFNEWSAAQLLSKDAFLSTYSRYAIWVLDLIFILMGCILIIQKDRAVYRWIGVMALSMAVILLLVGLIFRMGYYFQIDYNEGWNVYHSSEAIAGNSLYSDRATLTPINYPPLSFYVVGYAGKILHNPLLAGRIISLLSLLIISLEVGAVVGMLSRDNFSTFFSIIHCLGLYMVYARGYIAMNDPQMLGHVLVLMALIIYLKDRSKLIIVAFLCCLGLFTKHSLLPVPIAITLDILINSRKDFFKWIAVCLAISGSFLALISITLGSELIYQVLAPRGFDPQNIIVWMSRLGFPMFINLLLTLPWLYYAGKNKINIIAPMYMLISIIWGVYAIGGIGTDVNMFFDFFISLSIASGMSLFLINVKVQSLGEGKHLIHILAPLILGIGILAGAAKLYPRNYTFYQYSERENAFLTDVSYLSSKTGPVICYNILLCHAAGHSFIYDPFLVTEGILSGRFQEDEILSRLEAGYYQVVQLEYPIGDQYFEGQSYTSVRRSEATFTENFLRALGNNYVLTRTTLTGVFYEPGK